MDPDQHSTLNFPLGSGSTFESRREKVERKKLKNAWKLLGFFFINIVITNLNAHRSFVRLDPDPQKMNNAQPWYPQSRVKQYLTH